MGKKYNKLAKAWNYLIFEIIFKLTLCLHHEKKLKVTTGEQEAAIQERRWQIHTAVCTKREVQNRGLKN